MFYRKKCFFDEKIKMSSQYFWRTYDGAEIDLAEQRQDEIYAYEIKYNKIKKIRLSFKKILP